MEGVNQLRTGRAHCSPIKYQISLKRNLAETCWIGQVSLRRHHLFGHPSLDEWTIPLWWEFVDHVLNIFSHQNDEKWWQNDAKSAGLIVESWWTWWIMWQHLYSRRQWCSGRLPAQPSGVTTPGDESWIWSLVIMACSKIPQEMILPLKPSSSFVDFPLPWFHESSSGILKKPWLSEVEVKLGTRNITSSNMSQISQHLQILRSQYVPIIDTHKIQVTLIPVACGRTSVLPSARGGGKFTSSRRSSAGVVRDLPQLHSEFCGWHRFKAYPAYPAMTKCWDSTWFNSSTPTKISQDV